MFKDLTKGFLVGIAIHMLDKSRYLSVQLLKIEAAKFCLHGLRIARSSALGLMRLGLLIGLIGLGMVLFHAGLFILLPWTLAVRAALAMLLGLVYVAIGSIMLHLAMAEKTWMDNSGVTELLEKATGRPNRD
jgi:ABC-type proline/glycine betaine transport system permease subunit